MYKKMKIGTKATQSTRQSSLHNLRNEGEGFEHQVWPY